MKTIEEKAKAYDEIIERAKGDYTAYKKVGDIAGMDAVVSIFPELAEPKDERIMRALDDIMGLSKAWKIAEKYGLTAGDIRRWLKKQKEQATDESDKIAAAYQLGRSDERKQKEIQMPNSTELIEMWHDEEAMLKEKDFRGDEWRLAYNAFMGGFAKGTCVKFEKQKEQKPAEWSEEDESILNNITAYGYLNIDDLEWLKDLPNRFSLRLHWKPSEEQMNRLSSTIAKLRNDGFDYMAENLESIRDGLKKL